MQEEDLKVQLADLEKVLLHTLANSKGVGVGVGVRVGVGVGEWLCIKLHVQCLLTNFKNPDMQHTRLERVLLHRHANS